MNAKSMLTTVSRSEALVRHKEVHYSGSMDKSLLLQMTHPGLEDNIRSDSSPSGKPASLWSLSRRKRLFDCACVLLALPLVLPVFLLIAVAVRLTSAGPALFLQKRMGWHGRTFTILKFRTMLHDVDKGHHAVTTANNQKFTTIGPFLRRYKLDELPQLVNVILGHMSLVGPRPKMPEHMVAQLNCRPGITGAATIAFAREELLLDRIPKQSLNDYYHSVVLPAKSQLDATYMASATFRSDLRLIFDSVLRRWDSFTAETLLTVWEYEVANKRHRSRMHPVNMPAPNAPIHPNVDRPVPAEQLSGF